MPSTREDRLAVMEALAEMAADAATADLGYAHVRVPRLQRWAALLREAAERMAPQPIETAPKDETHILAWFHDDSPMRAYLGEHQSGWSMAAWTKHNGGGWVSNRHGTPTHWLPLPPAPGEPSAEEGP